MVGGLGYFLFFLVAFLSLTVLLIWPVFPYVVLAMLLAYVASPLNRRMERLIASERIRSALLTVLALVGFAVPLVFLIQRISRNIGAVLDIERASNLLERARTWLTVRGLESAADWMTELLAEGRDFIVGIIPSLFGSVFTVTLGIFVCLFVFYYFTKEGEQIWQIFLDTLPLPSDLKTDMNDEVTGILGAIFYGQLLTAIVQGCIGGVGLLIFQVGNPVVLTSLMILLSFFPFVGTGLIWGPAGLLKIMAGETWQGVGLLIFGVAVVMNVDNFLRPRLISMHSQVHPVVILIGIIGGTQVFGFIGFLVGPVIFAIFLRLLRFFAEYRAVEAEREASLSSSSSS